METKADEISAEEHKLFSKAIAMLEDNIKSPVSKNKNYNNGYIDGVEDSIIILKNIKGHPLRPR